jgi:hypothetical protein
MSEIWKYFKKLYPLEAKNLEFYVDNIKDLVEETVNEAMIKPRKRLAC